MTKKLMTVGAALIVGLLTVVVGVAGASGKTDDPPVSEQEFTDHCTENLEGTATVETDGNVSYWSCSWETADGEDMLNECWNETGEGGDIAHQNCSFPTDADTGQDDEWMPDQEALDSLAPDVFAPEEDDEPVLDPDQELAPDVGGVEEPAGEDSSPDEGDDSPSGSLRPVQEDSIGPEDAADGDPDDDSGPSEFPGFDRPEAVAGDSVVSR